MKLRYILSAAAILTAMTSCSDFLDEQVPQGVLSDQQVTDPAYVDNVVISAYAVFMSSEDINTSFSMWNFDVRSDDAYKGGNGTSDGDVFHQLEVQQGVLTTNWNINSMWERLYNCISRTNIALALLDKCNDSYELKQQRIAEMRFLRAYGHFLLKRLYKYIPFVLECNYTQNDYNNLSNREFSNDEGWQKIIDELEFAYNNLPEHQAEVGRPTKAAAAAFLAKVYLYKAYHQDDVSTHTVTEVNQDDLKKVIQYSDPSIYTSVGYGLEDDFHNNFRPEPEYENGKESIWAIQYSMNDGNTDGGNFNVGYGLITPNIPGVTDGGTDFYKPSQNLVNAYRVDNNGLPFIDSFNDKDYDMVTDFADPRLFLTVGLPGLPYEFNPSLIMDKTSVWSRSNGLYGYYVTLKQNVDPASGYLFFGKTSEYWVSAQNRIVFRYADVILERAEALAQLGETKDAIDLVNQIRERAKLSGDKGIISGYPHAYGVNMNVGKYTGTYSKEEALRIVKMERRLEMGMESERFFDLVRWGDAATVLTKYYVEEADNCNIYSSAVFTANKCEYLPVPFSQISASNGKYQQNIGNW